MALLRAFIDDSVAQEGDKRLFLAGYLHRGDRWAAFSEVWKAELEAWPSIAYFKAAEANSLRGQFDHKKGWTEGKRDAKIICLAGVIRAFRPFSFHFSLNRRVFEEELKPVSPRGFNPHFTACFAVVAGLSQYVAKEGITTPIEFVFDEQEGVASDIALFFSDLKKNLPEATQNLIYGMPIFKSDKDSLYLPLQAADLLAWHLRREHVLGISHPVADDLVNETGHLVGEIPDDMLRRWADHHGQLPGVPFLQSKTQWANAKSEIRRLIAAGIDPSKIKGAGVYYPEGTPAVVRAIAKVKRLFNDTRRFWGH